MSGAVDRVVDALRDAGCQPRPNGTGWTARCPAHDDRKPSLSIHSGDDGRALIHCHAGCKLEAIVELLGLSIRKLMPEQAHGPPQRKAGAARQRGAPANKESVATVYAEPPTCEDAGAPHRNGRAKSRQTWATLDDALKDQQPSAHWVYRDAEGKPVGAVLRFNKPGGEKRIIPLAKGGDERWRMQAMPAPRPLYRLPDLLAKPGEPVYVVEGEKCADALAACGLLATTSAGGCKAAAKSDWAPLRGRHVLIVPDNDEAGERYAADVVRLAKRAGARSIRIARLADAWPECPPGGDVADALGADGPWSGLDDEDVRTRIEALATPFEADADDAAPESPAWTPFPTDCLPDAAARLVRKGGDAMQVDEGMLGPLALAAMGAAIGNARVVQLSVSWREPAILWAVVVAPSGSGKSPALELVVRPVERRDAEAHRAYEEARKEHDAEMAVHKRDLRAWERGASTGAQADSPPRALEPPTCERFITNDTTLEALASMLSASPRGILLACDELASWLGGFTRYAGGNGRPASEAARWLPMHRAGSMKVDRKTSPPLRIERAALNIAGLIQPGVLASALTATDYDSGLAARLLLAMPPTPTRRWTPGGLSAQVESAYALMVDRLYALDLPEDERGDPEPRTLTLDDGAAAVWATYYNGLNADMAGADERTRAMLSKLEGGAARLALVAHLGRVADGEAVDPERIDGESMRRGVALARWFRREAERVYDRLGESETDAERRALIELVARKGGDVSARELMRSSRIYRTAPDAEAALQSLVDAGLGEWVQPRQQGRGAPKARRFTLNAFDSVDVDNNPTRDTESSNIVNVSSVNAFGAQRDGAPERLADDDPGDTPDAPPVGAFDVAEPDGFALDPVRPDFAHGLSEADARWLAGAG